MLHIATSNLILTVFALTMAVVLAESGVLLKSLEHKLTKLTSGKYRLRTPPNCVTGGLAELTSSETIDEEGDCRAAQFVWGRSVWGRAVPEWYCCDCPLDVTHVDCRLAENCGSTCENEEACIAMPGHKSDGCGVNYYQKYQALETDPCCECPANKAGCGSDQTCIAAFEDDGTCYKA